MTTLTPEREAVQQLYEVLADPRIPAVTRADAPPLLRTILATLSTERQAREAAEKEAAHWKHQHRAQCEVSQELDDERVATIEVAEKEVERLTAECALGDMRASYDDLMEQHRATLSKLRAAEAALSALPPPVPAEEGETVLREDESGNLREVLPTQAPQDVAGLVEREEDAGRELYGSGYHDGFLDGFLIGKGEDSYPDAEGEREISMQADSENIADGWAAARVPFLSALRDSPISHETETANEDLGPTAPWCALINPDGYKLDPLEPPAADNKALVENAQVRIAKVIELEEAGTCSFLALEVARSDRDRALIALGRNYLASFATKETEHG